MTTPCGDTPKRVAGTGTLRAQSTPGPNAIPIAASPTTRFHRGESRSEPAHDSPSNSEKSATRYPMRKTARNAKSQGIRDFPGTHSTGGGGYPTTNGEGRTVASYYGDVGAMGR